jgi:hypothetical protein
MDTPGDGQQGSPQEIVFANHNRARLVTLESGANAAEAPRRLGLERPKAVIMVAGAAVTMDENLRPRLRQLFSRGIARAAVDKEAVIIDGGTEAGVMQLMGQGVADRGRQTPLIGVAPRGRITYPGQAVSLSSHNDSAPLDSNHSHFVLVDSDEWGGETGTMFRLAAALAKGGGNEFERDAPALTILAGSAVGSIAQNEVLQTVRQGWPVIVLQGTGLLPDELTRLAEDRTRQEQAEQNQGGGSTRPAEARPLGSRPPIEDPDLAEIVEDGELVFFPPDGTPADLEKLIGQQLATRREESALDLAWAAFARYDANAVRQQRSHRLLNNWILSLGVVTTAVALTYVALTTSGNVAEASASAGVLRFFIIVLPITTSVLIAASLRLKSGNKWILLRSSAEAIKRRIYRYRLLAQYNPEKEAAALAEVVGDLSQALMQTEVNESALLAYDGPIPPRMFGAAADDDGLGPLTPERYLEIQLGDQLSFYDGKTRQLERRLRAAQGVVLLGGAAGTLMAAIRLELWVPLATAVVTAATTYLLYQQLQETLVKYNQARIGLENIQLWWRSLTPAQRLDPANVKRLATNAERTISREVTGWVQDMQSALAELRDMQSQARGES